ncbi:MAG: YtxH domain-containing protein [Aquificae bacterium]|nr:YtxH domain-containing protein [Aquificota bacterium]
MKRFFTLLVGVATGALATYLLTQRKEEILKKINEIQCLLSEIELKDKIQSSLNDIILKVKNLVKSEEEMTIEEKEKLLAEIEEKLEKLEESIKR